MSTSLASKTTNTTVHVAAVKPNVTRDAATNGVPPYVFTRFVLLRLLGLVYATAFLILVQQQDPLIGDGGILPAGRYLARIEAVVGFPRRCHQGASHVVLARCVGRRTARGRLGGLRVVAGGAAGATNALLQLALWALYLSFVQVGQLFYGYGWETQLCETGFLAIFLCPVRSIGPFASPPPPLVIWLYRWLIARIMVGAGLIKVRGDPCWRDLTCLVYHYETQPVPNPLSWWLNAAPRWVHVAGTAFNHVVELGAPFLMLAGRIGCRIAGVAFIAFQLVLIASGNLSFLNWLTIVPAIACLDDGWLRHAVPARWRGTVETQLAGRVPRTRSAWLRHY
jgi:hypothetical protein